jgi:hypothetical protein
MILLEVDGVSRCRFEGGSNGWSTSEALASLSRLLSLAIELRVRSTEPGSRRKVLSFGVLEANLKRVLCLEARSDWP